MGNRNNKKRFGVGYIKIMVAGGGARGVFDRCSISIPISHSIVSPFNRIELEVFSNIQLLRYFLPWNRSPMDLLIYLPQLGENTRSRGDLQIIKDLIWPYKMTTSLQGQRSKLLTSSITFQTLVPECISLLKAAAIIMASVTNILIYSTNSLRCLPKHGIMFYTRVISAFLSKRGKCTYRQYTHDHNPFQGSQIGCYNYKLCLQKIPVYSYKRES